MDGQGIEQTWGYKNLSISRDLTIPTPQAVAAGARSIERKSSWSWRNPLRRASTDSGHQTQFWMWFEDSSTKSSRQQLQQQLQQLLHQQSRLGSQQCISHVSLEPLLDPARVKEQEGTYFFSLSLSCSLGIFIEARPVVSSQGQNWGARVQVPSPSQSSGHLCLRLLPKPFVIPRLHRPPLTFKPLWDTFCFPHDSRNQEKDGFVDKQNSSSRTLLNL